MNKLYRRNDDGSWFQLVRVDVLSAKLDGRTQWVAVEGTGLYGLVNIAGDGAFKLEARDGIHEFDAFAVEESARLDGRVRLGLKMREGSLRSNP